LQNRNVPNENITTFTLDEAGIDRKLSSKAQKLAAIPAKDFEKKVAEGKQSGKLTSNTVMQSAKPNDAKPRKATVVPKPHYNAEAVMALYDAGIIHSEIAAKTGLSKRVVDDIIHEERLRRDGVPKISRDDLSPSAQQKFDLAIKQYKEKLTAEFHAAVNLRVQEFLENTIGPQLQKEQAEARRIMAARKGIMNSKEYRKVLACLHPDRVLDPGQKAIYTEAFRLFASLEKLVLNEKDSPTQFAGIPTTPAEWAELKRQANERRAKSRTERAVNHRK
jgi:hypothetical protein